MCVCVFFFTSPLASYREVPPPGVSFSFVEKYFSQEIFFIFFRLSNHQVVGKNNKPEFAFKSFLSEFKFALTLGYLYPVIKTLNLLQKPEDPAGYKRWISRKEI